MRKTTEYKVNRLAVSVEGLMAMLCCGEVTAKKRKMQFMQKQE